MILIIQFFTLLNGYNYQYLTEIISFDNRYLFAHSSDILDISIWPIHGTVTGSTIPAQSGLGSNGRHSKYGKALEFELHYQMVFSIISRLLVRGSYPSAEM